jgi:hypothetical protein
LLSPSAGWIALSEVSLSLGAEGISDTLVCAASSAWMTVGAAKADKVTKQTSNTRFFI